MIEDFTHVLPEDKPPKPKKKTSDEIYDLAKANEFSQAVLAQRRKHTETYLQAKENWTQKVLNRTVKRMPD